MTDEPLQPTRVSRPSRGLWTRHRRGLLTTLALRGDDLVPELYRRAIDAFGEQPLTPAALMVGSHCIRELANRLPRILGEVETVDHRGDGGATDRLVNVLARHASNPTSASTTRVLEAAQRVVIARDEATQRARQMRAALWLGGIDTSGGSFTLRSAKRATDAFEKYRHPQAKDLSGWPTEFTGELLEHLEFIERALDSRLGRFFDVVAELRAMLEPVNRKDDGQWVAPTPTTVRNALASAADAQHRRVFFHELRNPAWMTPLDQAGVFSDPPAQMTDETGTAPYQPWPQGDYLRMMAAERPDEATAILARVFHPDVAWSVKELVVTLASEVPPSAAAKLHIAVLASISEDFTRRFIGIDAVTVVEVLASGTTKHHRMAIELARHLLEPLPDPQPHDGPRAWLHARAASRVDETDYSDALQRTVTALGVDGHTLAEVSQWLAREQRFSGTYDPGDPGDPDRDVSSIRRPSIARPRHVMGSERIGDALIDCVRDCAVQLITNGEALSVLKVLRRQDAPIFTRIELHALAQVISTTSNAAAPNADPELIAAATERLLRPGAAHGAQFRRELDELARITLPLVDEAAYQRWENEMLREPNIDDRLRERIVAFSPSNLTEEQAVAAFVEERLLRRLTTVGPDTLRGNALAKYLDLAARYPDAGQHDPDREPQWNPEPDTAQQDLESLAPRQVLDLVSGLEAQSASSAPDGSWASGRQRELTHRALIHLVADDPAAYSAMAQRAFTLGPAVVHSYLAGLTESLRLDRDGRSFAAHDDSAGTAEHTRTGIAWSELLDAASGTRERGGHSDAPDTWRAVREELCLALEVGASDIPDSLLDQAISVAGEMRSDVDPTPSREAAEYAYVREDPVSYSMNTVRSSALRTVFKLVEAYVSRRDRAAQGAAGLDSREPASPDADPIVSRGLAIISSYVKPTRDPSLAVAAVFGEHAGWLLAHGPDWLEQHKAHLITPDAFGEVFMTTALESHIPHVGLITSLESGLTGLLARGEDVAAGIAAGESPRPRRGHSTVEVIGGRLVALFLRGHIDLTHPLLVSYNATAPAPERASVLGEVGWQFARSDSVDEDVLARAMTLWDGRLTAARDGSGSYEELADFESWIRCGFLPASWWLPRLIEVAQHTAPEGFRHVGEALTTAAEDHLPESLHALDMLIRAFAESRVISHTLRRAAPVVIELALKSPDAALQRQGDDLLNFIGRHGGPYLDPKLSELAQSRSSYPERNLQSHEDFSQESSAAQPRHGEEETR